MPTTALDTTAEVAPPAVESWAEVRRLEARLASEAHLLSFSDVHGLVAELRDARKRLLDALGSLTA